MNINIFTLLVLGVAVVSMCMSALPSYSLSSLLPILWTIADMNEPEGSWEQGPGETQPLLCHFDISERGSPYNPPLKYCEWIATSKPI